MILTRNQSQQQGIEIFFDTDYLIPKKKIEFKGVERQRNEEKKPTKKKKKNK
jgi:hypothetical protein